MDKIRTQFVKVRDNHFGSVKSVETRFANILTKLGTHTLVEDDPKTVEAPPQIQTPESKVSSSAPAQISETQVAAATTKVPLAEQVAETQAPAAQAKQAPPPAAQPKTVSAMSVRAMKAQGDEDDETAGKSKKTYSRRDMKPEK